MVGQVTLDVFLAEENEARKEWQRILRLCTVKRPDSGETIDMEKLKRYYPEFRRRFPEFCSEHLRWLDVSEG